MVLRSSGISLSYSLTYFITQMTAPPAEALILQAGILASPSSVALLDNAAGAGVVTVKLFELLGGRAEKPQVVLGDVEQKMIDLANARLGEDKKAELGIEVKVVDSLVCPLFHARVTRTDSERRVIRKLTLRTILSPTFSRTLVSKSFLIKPWPSKVCRVLLLVLFK